MKLIIDIPEYIYKLCQGHGDIVYKCIAKGTPLPKGHGDLIDRDELFKYKNGGEYNGIGFSREYVYVGDICNAPTIIEADKVE